MANNRLYIRCKQCGGTICIGKHSLGSLHLSGDADDFVNRLERFYSEHNYCGDCHYSLELCEEFPGEMTDNNIDDCGNVIWFNKNGYR